MKLRDKLLVPVGLALLAVLAIHLGALYAASTAWQTVDRQRTEGHDAVTEVLQAEVAFKNQVQSWKDVQLSSPDEAERRARYEHFRAREAEVRNRLAALASRPGGPRWARDEARGLIAEHSRISNVYRKSHESSQPPTEEAQGVERDLAGAMATFRQRVDVASNQEIAASIRQGELTVYGMVVGGGGLSLLIITLMLTIVHRLIVRPAQLASGLSKHLLDPAYVPPPELQDRLYELADDELGQLLHALVTLHVDLAEERADLASARRDLEGARAAAESAAEAKQAFLARVTHELRTPLHGVVGCLGLLRDESLSPDAEALMEAANASSQRLATLVEDILDFTQVSGGDLDLHHQSFDLQAMLDGLVNQHRARAETAGCTLTLAVATGGPRRVHTDRQRLYKVVDELVDNAISATPNGRVEIILTTANAASKARVRIDVLDDGPGIPADLMEAVFQPFTQVEDGYDRAKQGAGLGLSMCRRTVEHLGGRLQVAPGATGGTRFWVELTLDREMPSSRSASDRSTEDQTPLPGEPSAPRILVVGPGPVEPIREVGLGVLHVQDLDHALVAISEHAFPVTIVDITTIGIGAIADLRAIIDSTGSLTALVARVRSGDRDACLAEGWDDALDRAAEDEEVHAVVGRWLDIPIRLAS